MGSGLGRAAVPNAWESQFTHFNAPKIPMNLAHKLKKIGVPHTYRSAKRHFGLALLGRRPFSGLNLEDLIAAIDREKFDRMRRRYGVVRPGHDWPKYLELEKWMRINLRRVQDLGLDYGFRKRILDIGSGTGYFLHICRFLGHDVVGLDIDILPMYREMMQLLGLKRVVWEIEPFRPLPDLGRPFDLITCFMICFNGHKSEAVWGTAEWRFFLDDLESHLRPSGRIQLGFNRENDGQYFDENLRRFFTERGAVIDSRRVTIPPGKRNRTSAAGVLSQPRSRPFFDRGSPKLVPKKTT